MLQPVVSNSEVFVSRLTSEAITDLSATAFDALKRGRAKADIEKMLRNVCIRHHVCDVEIRVTYFPCGGSTVTIKTKETQVRFLHGTCL